MVVQIGKTILVWLAVIIIVGWLLYQLFTDPTGSAHTVSSIISGVGDGVSAIFTFIKAL